MTNFTAEPVLARLKDFQRRTVDYVFDRMYGDKNPTRRFLVADEVGLGKTMVAKGVIARTIEHLQDRVDRIDVVYVCSNSAIARQNVNRLNVMGSKDFALASRLTLLPTEVKGLRENKVNFVSFTPGTTFDLKSRSGVMRERSVLFRMLRDEDWLDERGLFRLLQGPAGASGWEQAAYKHLYDLDETLSDAFRESVCGDTEFAENLANLCQRFRRHRTESREDNESRYALIGELRNRLAKVCLDALEPDLIVLDEFQRFRNLLKRDDPTAELAQALFNYKDARVLMLSATPYKMLSLDHEQDDDHYPDFLSTLGFLFDSASAVEAARCEIAAFRRELLDLDPSNPQAVRSAREALQNRLRSVMCRTERVGVTARHDAMISEPPRPASLKPGDLRHAALIDGVSQQVGSHDAIEYWKSTPYPLNFMKGYELRRNLERMRGDRLADVSRLVGSHAGQLLRGGQFENYTDIDPANARLRTLFADTLEPGLWRVLWLPPSLPFWKPSGAFAQIEGATKSLVFSAWNVVPDSIAALCSYEAERHMVAGMQRSDLRHSALYERVKPLLRFSRDAEGRLTGMPAILHLYPCVTLASLIDPIALALEIGGVEPPSLEDTLALAESRLARELGLLTDGAPSDGREDERWYWAAPAMLDRQAFPEALSWCASNAGEIDAGDAESSASYREHLQYLVSASRRDIKPELGRPPADLARVVAEVALAGPAVCALRSLRRVSRGLAWDSAYLLDAASRVASGFRSLFNMPESITLLRGEDVGVDSYWRIVLRHGLEGNVASLLDEQVHVLQESLGLTDVLPETRVKGISSELQASLSIRTSQLSVDELVPSIETGHIDISTIKLRCRFALRFGEIKDEKTEARIETVRSAFNSPFRPFVLASTSVGQEGLDFHTWCHAVVHWNLPSNPVDLEQREGRVHRYKGHAVRKNVARKLGLGALRANWTFGEDPWQVLFTAARKQCSSDLEAYWLFETEGGASIERRVPLLPFSRDAAQLVRLKRGLALYRLVFGQPRQEDLLTHLAQRLKPEEIERAMLEWRIDLSPVSNG